MRIPRLPARPWVAVAAVVAAAAILFTVLHQGNATAQNSPPEEPANTLAHLIVPDGEDPRIRVSWDGSDAGATGYTITRGDGQTFQADGTETTFSDHSVEAGAAYSYTVTANNDQGTSPASAEASASVADAPLTPQSLAAAVAASTATDETASVTLTWTASSVPPVEQCDTAYPLDGYTISRSDGTDEVELGTTGADATSFIDPSAAFSRNYTYRVAARNAIGTSPAAETAATILSRPILPPTGLTAAITDPFDGNVSLSWTAPAAGPEIAGYLVLRYDGADPYAGNAIPTTLAELATETTLVDSNVNAGSTYSYVVIARSADNVSLPADSAAIEPPAPPTSLAATAANGTIGVSWTAPDAGTIGTYQLERQPESGEWAHLADATETSHYDDTAEDNETYTYRVQHRNDHGGSTWSTSDAVTLVVAPSAPTGASATASGSDNVLTWTAPDSPFIDGYHVRHRTGDGDWASLADNIAAGTVTYTHQDAAADVTHHYAVRAHNSAGNGPWSDTASTGRVTSPMAPTGVNAALNDDDIILTWTRPSSVHVDGYTVQHQAGADQEFVASERLAGTATSYTIADITGDTVYRLAVRAHNSGGDSPWSEAVQVERVLMPSVPTSVSVAADEVNITLSWTTPEIGRVAGYHVSYGTAESEARESANIDAGQTSFVHTDSVEGTAYAYQVRAHNSAGNGPWSDTVQATRLLVPAAPSNLEAAASAASIGVTWQAPEVSIVASYDIEYGLSSGTERTTASVSGEHDYFIHTGSQGDVQYQYRVRSVNAAGQSPWTDAVTATRVLSPGKPTNVAAAISGDNIEVTWSAPESVFIDGYHVELRQQELQDWTRHTVTGATSFTHESPDAGATYEYRVRTHNAGGVSNWSSKATAIWYEGAAPPGSVSAQPWNNNTQLLIRWTPSETSGVTGYEVRHRIDGGDWSSETTTSTLVFHDWDPDTEDLREYSVRSQKDATYGDWSAIRKFTIAQPSAVTGVVTNLEGTNGVRLHWDEPDSGQPTQYFIDYNTGNGNWIRFGNSAGYQRTHRFASQPYDSTYSFRVMAVNDVYMTGPAGETTVTMAAEPQHHSNMPDNLKVKMLDRDRVRLKWDAPEDYPTGVSGYRIYRKDVTDPTTLMRFGWEETLVRHTGGTERTYVDLTTQPGRLYAYAVAAYRIDDDNRLSPASNPAYAQPW